MFFCRRNGFRFTILMLAALCAWGSAVAARAQVKIIGQTPDSNGQDNSPVEKKNPSVPWVYTAGGAAQEQGFRVGGVSLVLPAPASDLTEVGNDNRVLFEVTVPDMNRLVAAFVPSSNLAGLRTPKNQLKQYALVEVSRRAEFLDVGLSDFNLLAGNLGKQMGSIADVHRQENEDLFNRRMKAMNLNQKLTLGKPVMLGALFSKDNAAGFGMVEQVTVNGNSAKMMVATVLLRVKNRVLFAYLFTEYKDEQTVNWSRKTSEQWADAILVANRQ
jgi:hypothetical protein